MRLILAFVIMVYGFASFAAEKGSVTFVMSSSSIYAVGVIFYSQADSSRTWPKNGQVVNLDDNEKHAYKIRCEVGELICFGAFWDNFKRDWGVGKDNKKKCEKCCLTCAPEEQKVWHYYHLNDG